MCLHWGPLHEKILLNGSKEIFPNKKKQYLLTTLQSQVYKIRNVMNIVSDNS